MAPRGHPWEGFVARPARSRNAGLSFEPEVIAVMSEAFEAACKAHRNAGVPKRVHEVIAGRIIAAASIGEHDPVRLRAVASQAAASDSPPGPA
jgi:hypothetical protein